MKGKAKKKKKKKKESGTNGPQFDSDEKTGTSTHLPGKCDGEPEISET
jgi:hypothetical protein